MCNIRSTQLASVLREQLMRCPLPDLGHWTCSTSPTFYTATSLTLIYHPRYAIFNYASVLHSTQSVLLHNFLFYPLSFTLQFFCVTSSYVRSVCSWSLQDFRDQHFSPFQDYAGSQNNVQAELMCGFVSKCLCLYSIYS